MYVSAAKVHLPSYNPDLWPDLENFFSNSHHVMNNCAKFHWNPSSSKENSRHVKQVLADGQMDDWNTQCLLSPIVGSGGIKGINISRWLHQNCDWWTILSLYKMVYDGEPSIGTPSPASLSVTFKDSSHDYRKYLGKVSFKSISGSAAIDFTKFPRPFATWPWPLTPWSWKPFHQGPLTCAKFHSNLPTSK